MEDVSQAKLESDAGGPGGSRIGTGTEAYERD